MEGGIYISPEFQLGQVYDGAADVVEDVILYRPVYVCAPRPPGSDIGNGHSPSVRGADHTPSPSPVAGSPSAAGKPRAGGVSPAGSVERVNAHSSPAHGKTTATRTTKKVESTTTTVDGRSNEHHHQHHHHYHHPPHQHQKEELIEPLQQGRSSHEVIVHGTASSDRGGRDLDPAKPAVIAATADSEKAATHDDVRLTDCSDASGTASTKNEAVTTETCVRGVELGAVDSHELTASSKHIRNTTSSTTTTTTTMVVVSSSVTVTDVAGDTTVLRDHTASSSGAAGDCNSTDTAGSGLCVDVATAERESTHPARHPTPIN